MFMSSLSALPAPQPGVHTHPVLSNLISSHSRSHLPNPVSLCWLPPHSPDPFNLSWWFVLKELFNSLPHCPPCSGSFPDKDLSCGHLLTHKLYPIYFLLDFPFLLFHSDFSRSLYAFRATSPFLCNEFIQALIFPYDFPALFFQPQPLLPPHFLYLDPHHQPQNSAAPGTRVTDD